MNHCPACSADVSAGSRYCPACGAALAAEPLPPTGPYQPAAEPMPSPAPRSPSPVPSSTQPSRPIRFAPGTLLAERYRIVAALGKGGMGEVYRADDLTLGQTVALKFLPEPLAQDPQRLANFHNEVRLARQISHPHVCRVYDIGAVDGQPFLSMEYVDGEDLASLLRRIGRVPPDKGVEIARQLCLGLAAAHDKGVLHRDLKPANVMLDGRGQVRITDFGLARLAEQITGAEARAGTPRYMAPEQLAGQEVTVRSDLYALGLVLYELFTGQKAFKARSAAEMARLQDKSAPTSPSSHVSDLDPAIERVILRCLARDPRQRPASAVAVAAALPGGDPLAAALAAGETPSPEMVAAAGESEGLRPAVAATCLAGVLLGLAALVLIAPQALLTERVRLDEPPEVLARRAQGILKELGYEQPARASAFGFASDQDYLSYIEEHDRSLQRWDRLAHPQPAAVYFWYRQSPHSLIPERFFMPDNSGVSMASRGLVTLTDPPAVLSGMVTVRLDLKGQLLGLEIVPPQQALLEEPARQPNWERLFQLAGLPFRDFTATKPIWNPPVYAQAPQAWSATGVYETWPEAEVRVEAAAYHGQPVSFQVIGPWSVAARDQPEPSQPLTIIAAVGYAVLTFLLMLGAVPFAIRNVRLGRGDRPGAFRLALVIFFVLLSSCLVVAGHGRSFAELDFVMMLVAQALLWAAELWLFYLALEPYVRRLWPHILISWSRLLTGRWRDPLVGRDLLLGTLWGIHCNLLFELPLVIPSWLGLLPPQPLFWTILNDLLGGRFWIAELAWTIYNGVVSGMYAVLFLFLLRLLLRKQWLAASCVIAIYTVLASAWIVPPYLAWFFMGLAHALFVFLLFRFGMLAVMVGMVVSVCLWVPLTPNLSAWYSGAELFFMGVVLTLAGYGFWTSLAGRSLFREELLLGE